MNITKFIITILLILFNCNSIAHKEILEKYKNLIIDTTPFQNLLENENSKISHLKLNRESEVKSIILHSTGKLSAKEHLNLSLQNDFLYHILISKEGKLFGEKNPAIYHYKLIPSMDASSIHIVMEGEENEILKNKIQIEKIIEIIKYLSIELGIKKENFNIDEKQGIFTHMQAKKRYGYFSELTECGGEKLIKLILENIGGEFFSEEKWYNRFERYWIARKEKISSYKPGKKKFDRGRGITKQKPLLLESLEKNEEGFTPEEYRLQYEFKQSIEPSCIVLHYTAIPSFKRSQEVLEMRGLSASIMVDDDGKAYQLVDTLNDMSQAASGTNDKCIQVEIVARNTDDLMKNEIQSKKVTELVKEISKKFEIEITNEKIESFNGVFSHTQAKKKFGGSSALIGKEFDPGEIYMEKIIKGAGGKFYKEENWFNRNSEDWVMIFKDFQP